MNEYVTFKRTALLMLMFITAWCLPVKGQMVENNGYQFYADWVGHRYEGSNIGGFNFDSNASITFPEERSDVYVLIKLTDPAQKDQFQIAVNGKRFDADGKLWVEPNDFDSELPTFSCNIGYIGDQPAGRKYELTTYLYAEKDEESVPLAVFDGCIEFVSPVEFSFPSKRVVGEVEQSIPLSITVKGNSSLSGLQNTSLVIGKPGAIELKATDGTPIREENSEYYIDLSSLSSLMTFSFDLKATAEVTGHLSLRVITKEGIALPYQSGLDISIPFNVSEEDVNGLKAIATANNNNQTLNDYVNNKGWLTDDGSWDNPVSTDWDESASPARLRTLRLRNFKEALDTVNVAPFDSLESLEIQNCNITSLDLSMLKKLRWISVYNTKIQNLSAIKLPSGNPDLQVFGNTIITIGTPVEGLDNLCEMPVGTEVDLSAYATIDGETATFTWYKYGNYGGQEIVDWAPVRPGVYTLPAQPEDGVTYGCEIKVASNPEWIYRTSTIRLTRGSINYSPADIQLLKDLAAANPDCEQLQKYIEAEGWTEPWQEFYDGNDENRHIDTDWSYDNPARISKLRVRDLKTIQSFDVSKFTELTYLDCISLSLRSLDLSKNTKLEELHSDNNLLTSLDVSKCPDIRIINSAYNQDRDNNWAFTLESLNISGCSKLEVIRVPGAKLSTLDLSRATDLKELSVSNNPIDVDLSKIKALNSLFIEYTDKLERYAVNPPTSLTALFCVGTDYPLLDFASCPNITQYTIPRTVKELDISATNINHLGVSSSGLKYSTFTPNTVLRDVYGESIISIPGAKKENEYNYYTIQNGDTVDLSSEATIGGIQSQYVWVDGESHTETNDAFLPVKDQPGKFVANGKQDKFYYCLISNSKYCQESTVNQHSGWRIRTYDVQVKLPPATYDTDEVAALKAIVDGCKSPSLKAWWDSEAWKNGYYLDDWRFNAWWMLDQETNTYHLSDLQLNSLQDTLTTLDVSAFEGLTALSCESSGLTSLSVAENANLVVLSCGYSPELTTLTLPEDKTHLEFLQCDGCTKLETLDVAGYTNLISLSVRSCKFESLELSQLSKLEYLWCNGTKLTVDVTNHPKLRGYGVPRNVESFDMNTLDSLQTLDPTYSKLKFSTVKLKEGKPWSGGYYSTSLPIEGFRSYASGVTRYLVPAGKPIDLSSEMSIDGKASNVKWTAYDSETEAEKAVQVTGEGKFTISGRAKDRFEAIITNETFPGWEMSVCGEFYTRDGDANLDDKVDVRDISVTANWILQNENVLPNSDFGWYEADVNVDDKIEIADITGIANLIMGKPVTKSNDLRSEFVPVVCLTAEDGFLCMETDIPVAGVQLSLTGMVKAEPLLGKAASFTQASYAGDTLRMLAYSLKGETIPAGKTALMRWPEGARLAGAAFSDAQARSLKVETRGDIATSNEKIGLSSYDRILNYPNPFRGTTTLVYQLDEPVDNAFIQVYALNGSLVDVVEGLGTQAGENRFVYSTRLTGGTYIYRLVTQKQGVTTYSKSNTFMIK
ncbi:T9SS type A sorting domain-containing protein [uncultured Parabacteroides sp.]|uniref:T9SS type A sorting domain-containing protein n=2 Tax=uncultured Parabacteroides sp. TaxID=512312 RepID=UPI0026772848|nr:T9SS type A sorting domain-containing protein [uncultured Parabacteroides sp.]